jgi:hypothetical protein
MQSVYISDSAGVTCSYGLIINPNRVYKPSYTWQWESFFCK